MNTVTNIDTNEVETGMTRLIALTVDNNIMFLIFTTRECRFSFETDS